MRNLQTAFALEYSAVRLSFLIKMNALKLDKWKVHFCFPWDQNNVTFRFICFCSQNVYRRFLYKTIILFTT